MIRQSDTIDKLAVALVHAQAELTNAPKDTRGQVGNQVRYYTDLPTLTDLVRPVLSKFKLAFTQLPSGGGDGTVSLTTRLLHESGEWLEDTYTMPAGQGAQAVGSALTYARRYSLMALLGIAADDDDGAAASQPARRTRNQTAATRPPEAPVAPAGDSEPIYMITDAQIKKMMAGFNDRGIKDRAERLAFIASHARQVESSRDLTRTEACQVIDALEQDNQ